MIRKMLIIRSNNTNANQTQFTYLLLPYITTNEMRVINYKGINM